MFTANVIWNTAIMLLTLNLIKHSGKVSLRLAPLALVKEFSLNFHFNDL